MRPTFLEAAKAGRLDLVREYIEQKQTSIDQQHPTTGNTALYEAAAKGHKDVVKYLLEKKANPNLPNLQKATPLHAASIQKEFEIITLLCQNGANKEARSEDGATPLFWSTRVGNLQGTKRLIAEKANVNAILGPGDKNITPLYFIASDNTNTRLPSPQLYAIIQQLVAAGANVNLGPADDFKAIHHLALKVKNEGVHQKILPLLIEARAELEEDLFKEHKSIGLTPELENSKKALEQSYAEACAVLARFQKTSASTKTPLSPHICLVASELEKLQKENISPNSPTSDIFTISRF